MDNSGTAVRAPLVGRAEELAWLERTLERGRRGRPAIAVLSGEAGIGKTRLLRETARRARQLGFRSISGSCFEDLTEPFLPFVDALDDALHDLATALPDCDEAARLIDVITGRQAPTASEGPAANPDATHHRVLRVVTRALFSLARDVPVFLSLDDLHWADGPSLRLLEHLALRLDDDVYLADPLRLVVVAAARSDEGGDWGATLTRLRGEAVATVMEVTGLRPPEVADLLEAGEHRGLSPVVVRRLATITRGNPLHLESLIGSLDRDEMVVIDEARLSAAAVPATIGAMATRALEDVQREARDVLEVVAVTSGDTDVGLISAVLGIAEDAAIARLKECIDARILTGSARPEFTHSVHRHACLAVMAPVRSRALHARVLAALLARPGGSPPEQLARHALAAEAEVDRLVRVTWAIDAAKRRMAATDWAAAAELFDAARAIGADLLDDPKARADVELNAALCHIWTGRTVDLNERLAVAADWYGRAKDIVGVTLVHLAAVRARLTTGAWGEPVDVSELEGQLDVVVDAHPELAALVQADLAMALWVGGRSEDAVASARVAADMAERSGSPVAAARAYTALGIGLLTLLEFGASRTALERGLAIARSAGDPMEELMVLIRLPLTTGLMGDTRECKRHADRALELCRQLDAPHDAEFALAALCNLAGGRGDFIAAEQSAAEVCSIARLTGSPWATPFVRAAVFAGRATRGDWDGARRALADLLPDDPGLAAWVEDSPSHRIAGGLVASMEGDLARATELVTAQAVADLLAQPAILGNGAHLAAVVEVARSLNDPNLAAAVLPGLTDLVGRGQVVSAGMPFLLTRSVGVALRLVGREDEARSSLHAAQEIAHAEGLRVEEVRTLLDLADLATSAGDARVATDLRGAAAADISALGMWGLAPRAGLKPRPSGSLTTDRLGTPAVGHSRSTILFADISASTRSTEELGDLAFRFRSRQAEAAMRAAVTAVGGRAIEGIRLGDGILAEFTTARAAVVAGLAMIDSVATCGLEVHLGVHQGDVIRDDRSIFGGAVNLTARICDAAGPSELLVSEVVAAGLAAVDDLAVLDVGEHALKGIASPIGLYRVTETNRQQGATHEVPLVSPEG